MSAITNPHTRSVDHVTTELGVDTSKGLDSEEARTRLERVGPNRIEEDRGPTRLQLLARQFTDVLVLILIAAALISGLLLGDWVEALVIVAIVLINAAIGFTQEAKAADAAEGLRRLTSPHANVVRNGQEQRIATEAIVPGDLIIIETGDRVFADARLIDASRLDMDESELTGESTPVAKSTEPVAAGSVIGDRTSMIFSGTVAVSGRGLAVVTATGYDTEIGHIADMLREEEPPTPLERELGHVGKRLGVLAGAIAAIVLVVGLLEGRPLESMFLLAVALAVAAIPEGLPAVVGVTLGRGVQRMARRNAIVRRMPAVEALGAVTVICTDKTGTLTKNEMLVQEMRVDDERIDDLETRADDPRVQRFAVLSILCNDSRRTEDGWKGDPTEIALLRASSALVDPVSAREQWPRVDEIPFDSSRKRMTTAHRSGQESMIVVKGAPEVIVPRSTRIETVTGTSPLDPAEADSWLSSAEDMAVRGLRTLAVAYKKVDTIPTDLESLEEDLVLTALIGMSDELRPEAKPSVDEARGAGVRVVMITGDHEVTASSIAEGLGLLDGHEVIGGRQLHSLGDAEYDARVAEIGTYARVDPSDKVRIVRAWQARDEIVAMTGDGVNDAPALRIADIGVAMGSGTDVARDASDIVLADDNFATIVSAVRGGRTIFSNIRKVIAFLLAANVSEVIVVFLGFLLFSSLGDPLLATQILWVNLVTDGLPAVALGFDPPDSRVMLRPPSRRRSLLSRSSQLTIAIRGTILSGFVLAAFGYGMVRDFPWETTRTLGFTVLVLVQLTYVYALRVSESGWKEGLSRNALLHGAVALSAALQVLVVSLPVGNSLFTTTPLGADGWLVAVGLAMGAALAVVAASALTPSLRDQD
ncbi:MAG: cation-translocating P-type ATPase [Acidimicrobiia bacterium]|jgi:Ca2+-transporting ATPase